MPGGKVTGKIVAVTESGNLVTDRLFNDFKLHLEFRYPKGGNSGVYLRGRYEVQIADVEGDGTAVGDLGAVYGFLPLMVPPIYVSLEKLDKRLLEASADLGADSWRTFLQVTLPLSLPGVATGSMLVFILLMGDYILPQFLGGGKVFFIGNALVDLFLQSRNWPFGAAVSMALVAVMFTTIVIYMRFLLGKSGQRRAALV